jgi:hypothetical protein
MCSERSEGVGACLCGAVRFRLTPPLREVILCHCDQCRKWSGHFWAATSVPLERFHLEPGAPVTWFASSDHARRGFCTHCGSSLFWEPLGQGRISVAAGALDKPTGLRGGEVWHRESAGDYYSP